MGKLYHDVDIVERTEITKAGRIEKAYRVTATTASGVLFSIDVTQADFTKAKVDELLTKRAQEIEAIKAL